MPAPLLGGAEGGSVHGNSSTSKPAGLRVCSKITSDFGGSAAWPDARREEGASPPVGCERRATKQMARRRPAPEGWGCLAVWRRCSLLTDRWRVCSSLAPSQTAKQPPAKSEFIFEQTLSRFLAQLVLLPAPWIGADSLRLAPPGLHFQRGGRGNGAQFRDD